MQIVTQDNLPTPPDVGADQPSVAPVENVSQEQKPLPPSEPLFFTLGQSVIGSEHLEGKYKGNGNQDCRGFREVTKGLIGVSCDGCGSTPDSSTGSRAAVRIILNICQELLGREDIPAPKEFASELQLKLLERVLACALPLSRDEKTLNDILYQSYLFTVQVLVVTPIWTAVMGCGDGYWALNDDPEEVKPREGNQPEYLTYLLMNPIPEGFENIAIKVFRQEDTLKVRHAMVGTDGISPLIKGAQLPDSGKVYLAEFWRKATFFKQPQTVAMVMSELSEDSDRLETKPGFRGESVEVRIVRKRNMFHDDASFVIIRRNDSVSLLPPVWHEYRAARVPTPAIEEKTKVQSSFGTAPAKDETKVALKPAQADVPSTASGGAKMDIPKENELLKNLAALWKRVWDYFTGFTTPPSDPPTPPAKS